MIYVLSFRDPDRRDGGAVCGGRLEQWIGGRIVRTGPELVSELAAEGRVAFLIHGFNINSERGRCQLEKLAHMLQSRISGALVATLWPGDSLLGAISYSFEGYQADDTAENLTRFIADNINPATSVSFVTHSLGARVGLGTVERLLKYDFEVDQVCLMGAAVDDDCLANPVLYRDAVRQSNRVSVLHSDHDRVLRLAYPIGDLLQGFLFFWRDSPGFALGLNGPKRHDELPVPENVTHLAIGDYGVRHRDYFPAWNKSPNKKQRFAINYAIEVLARAPNPQYGKD